MLVWWKDATRTSEHADPMNVTLHTLRASPEAPSHSAEDGVVRWSTATVYTALLLMALLALCIRLRGTFEAYSFRGTCCCGVDCTYNAVPRHVALRLQGDHRAGRSGGVI